MRPILTAARASLKAVALGALWALFAGVAQAREQTILNFQVEGGANATAFAWRDGAEILVEPELIKLLGLNGPAAGPDLVSLHAVRGLAYVLNEATASVNIMCTATCFAPHILEEKEGVEAVAPAVTGLIVNYDLSASAIDGKWRGGGLFDGVMLGKTARIEASALSDSERGLQRFETAWVKDRAKGRTRLRVGDSVSRGAGWALPVRYGGVKFGTDFALDPAFISFPTPQMGGATSLPSTLDIYVNDTLRQRRETPAGPFTVVDPPFATGANTATVVITDALGREQVVSQAFYVAPTLLRNGLLDYTVDLGVQRRNYIEKSNDYADPLAGLTLRRGFKRLTGEVHAEAQRGAKALGASIAGASVLLGEGEAGFAASDSNRGAGMLASLGWMRVSNRFTVSARVEAASRTFSRIGDNASLDRLRATASASWNDAWEGGYALTLAQAHTWDGMQSRSWTGTYSRPVSARANLQLTTLVIEEPRASVALSLSLATTFGKRRSASAQIESNSQGVRTSVRAQQTPNSTGGAGWRLSASEGKTAQYDGGGYAITRIGEGEVELSKSGERTGARAGFRGGLALLDGSFYAARPLRDAFAVAEAPAGMDVLLDNRRVARTGSRGRVLITDLRANEINRLSLDVDQAPPDALIGASEIVARPGARGGAQAKFKIQIQATRWIEIVDANGAALPRGVLLTRGDGAQFFTGDDGLAFVARTETEQVLTAAIAGKACRIDLNQTGERLICAP